MKNILASIGLISLGIVALVAVAAIGMMLTGQSALADNYAYSGNDYSGCSCAEWVDYDDEAIKNTKRAAERPGTYQVVGLTSTFISELHAIEPHISNLGFPFQKDGKVWGKSLADTAKAFVQGSRGSNGQRRNPWRLYNINIHDIRFLHLNANESKITDPKSLYLSKRDLARFKAIRKKHPERCVLVHAAFTGESLESEQVIGGTAERGFILLWAKKEPGWKLVWFAE